jgi:origin recognition complex subunit 3
LFQKLQSESYGKVLSNLLSFIQNIDFEESKNLQTAVLLTGVNQTDHLKQFETLSLQIANNCPSIITILQSRDCPTVKSAVEVLVSGIINQNIIEIDDEEIHQKLKKKQLTFPVLEAWYQHNYGLSSTKPSLIVMINDFDQFNSTCMQELITIMCSYTNRLPFVLVLGIATAFKTLHNVLPSHITNKIDANVFQSESSTEMLNKILEEIILTHHSPVQLSGKSFKILMDIFLFYDYSLHSFIKGYKVFMLEHFYSRPLSAKFSIHGDKISEVTDEEYDAIKRSCLSFRALVEAEQDPQMKIDLISSNDVLRKKIFRIFIRLERYWFRFYCMIRVLVVLFEDLPKNDLGKLLREIYPICIASDVTKLDEYKECFKLLQFTSKDKFLAKLDKVLAIFDRQLSDETIHETQKKDFRTIHENLLFHRDKIAAAGMSPQKETVEAKAAPITPSSQANKKGATSRQEMMEMLKENAKNNPTRVLIEYEQKLSDCLGYLNSRIETYLRPIHEAPVFHEFTIFTDCQSVRRQIVGAPRGALHNALFNPHHYLQCSCCAMPESEQILATLPDTAIAYKLHLECNKFINLYDWLQAFAMVIEVNEDEDDISQEIQ